MKNYLRSGCIEASSGEGIGNSLVNFPPGKIINIVKWKTLGELVVSIIKMLKQANDCSICTTTRN